MSKFLKALSDQVPECPSVFKQLNHLIHLRYSAKNERHLRHLLTITILLKELVLIRSKRTKK